MRANAQASHWQAAVAPDDNLGNQKRASCAYRPRSPTPVRTPRARGGEREQAGAQCDTPPMMGLAHNIKRRRTLAAIRWCENHVCDEAEHDDDNDRRDDRNQKELVLHNLLHRRRRRCHFK
jgi:hypothetical protein